MAFGSHAREVSDCDQREDEAASDDVGFHKLKFEIGPTGRLEPIDRTYKPIASSE